MYSMKTVCKATGMTYETLKYYCKEGLIPNVKRDSHNYRIFDDRDIAWIESLSCLKKCGMRISEMKQYVTLCLQGASSIPDRKIILQKKKEFLMEKQKEIFDSIGYIDTKLQFYQDVQDQKVPYISNLIK